MRRVEYTEEDPKPQVLLSIAGAAATPPATDLTRYLCI